MHLLRQVRDAVMFAAPTFAIGHRAPAESIVGGRCAFAEEDKKDLFIQPQARGDARALVGAAALGSVVGLAIGGAYLFGGVARDAVVHAQIQRLAGSASTGFSEVALDSSAKADPGALSIARRLDPLATADLNPRERRVAALVERLRTGKPAEAGTTSLAANVPASSPVIRANFASPGAAAPFLLRGALDESRDLECLSQAVYYEARGETPSGQAAVAQVVLNRVRHPAFPKSICAVVFQGTRTSSCQFSFACDGASHHPLDSLAWRRAEKVAAKALDGGVMSEVGNATHFHAAGVNTGWGPSLLKVAQIGSHIFYRFGGHAGGSQMFHGDVKPSDKAVEVRPVFASLVPALPSAQQTGQVLAAGAAVVEHAAAAVENAAKAAVSSGDAVKPQSAKPAAVVAAPASAPSTAPADGGGKGEAAAA
jgi:spore germination cell wall hydrolase CwlJ-like protein